MGSERVGAHAQKRTFRVVGIGDEARSQTRPRPPRHRSRSRRAARRCSFRPSHAQAAGTGQFHQPAHRITGRWASAASRIDAKRRHGPRDQIVQHQPQGVCSRSARPTGPGFQMSKARNSRKAASQPGQSAVISAPTHQAPNVTGRSATHWPATFRRSRSRTGRAWAPRVSSVVAHVPRAMTLRRARASTRKGPPRPVQRQQSGQGGEGAPCPRRGLPQQAHIEEGGDQAGHGRSRGDGGQRGNAFLPPGGIPAARMWWP